MSERYKMVLLIEQHLGRHQHMDIQDVYKMLYQGVFGAEHLVVDVEEAKKSLIEEWNRIRADKSEILTESVSLDGLVVRLYLRRCKAERFSVNSVWFALQRSLGQMHGDVFHFADVWLQFVQLCRSGVLPFDHVQAALFGVQAKTANWPSKHHSAAYREANKPAYRVVLRKELKEIYK